MRRSGLFVSVAVVVASCSSGGSGAPAESALGPSATTELASPTTSATTTSTVPQADTAATTTAPPGPLEPLSLPTVAPTAIDLTVTGPEEVVFDWTTDRCEDEHIPDIAPRAFRTSDGQAHLTIGHYVTYRMSGPNLDELVSDCSQPQLDSDYDPNPEQFNDSEWIGATFTPDGETVYAVIHNEYRGDTHGAARPGQCPTGERLRCLDTSFTMAVSNDGGATFDDIAPAPGHLIASLPYPYDDDGVPSGIRQPSNIVSGPDGYFYLFGNISDQPDEAQWVCAMRTQDLSDPSSWRYWDGTGFTGEWKDPYREEVTADDKCAPLADSALSGSLNESVIFDESIGRFVSVGVSFEPGGTEPNWAVYASTSDDLVNWSTRRLLLEVPVNNTVDDPNNQTVHAYPALIDTDSTSPNFETSDGSFHLYMSRFNFGGNSLDRDLLRWPVSFSEADVDAPVWTFDDGDTTAWQPTNAFGGFDVADGTLNAEVIGEDPSMAVFGLRVPASWNQLTVRMRADGGDSAAQLFFVTDADGEEGESKSFRFDVIGDGELRDYTLDLSTNPAWDGVITALRFDPVDGGSRNVEIDAIVLSE